MIASLRISASFNYWGTSRHPAISKAYSVANGTVGDLKSHVSDVKDVRSESGNFTLDRTGFAFVKHHSPLISRDDSTSSEDANSLSVAVQFQDPDFVTKNYWPEVCTALRQHLTPEISVEQRDNATSTSHLLTIPMQTAIRTSVVSKFTPRTGPHRMSASSPPAKVVHNDYSPIGARTVLRSMLTTYMDDTGIASLYSADKRDRFLAQREQIIKAEDEKIQDAKLPSLREWNGKNYDGPRWAIYSVWRPFETVRRDPLGLVDARSMFELPERDHRWEESYMPVPLPHRGYVGFVPEYEMVNMTQLLPSMNPAAKEEYDWYYMREQTADDLLIIKLFDSDAWKDRSSGIAPCSAHSAFELDDQDGERPRRSIEVRVLVMW